MNWKKVLKWTGLVLLGLIAVFFIINIQMDFRTNDRKTLQKFQEQGFTPNIERIPFRDWELRYIHNCIRCEEKIPVVLFVHGAPGSANNYYKYLSDSTLLSRAHLVTMDRPGYGYSSYGRSAPDFRTQAAAVAAVLDQFPGQPAILVGHSYGGPILGRSALDFPEKLSAILMLAPVNNPESEPFHRLSIVTRWAATRWLFSRAWRVAGEEKGAHIAELQQLADGWKDIGLPVVHIHGEKDFLAPPDNIAFSREHIPAQHLRMIVLPEASHFIPWTQYDLVRDELIRLLES